MKPKLFQVVAMARNRVIGKDGKLPWHFPADLKYFKTLTWGSTVLMGRKTFESLGKPLPGRENFVLTRSKGDRHQKVPVPFCSFFGSLDEALAAVRTPDCYIIGGAEIFRQTLGKVDGIYLTQIDQVYEGDAFYPEVPPFLKEKKRTLLQENPRLEVIDYEK